jgi:hypothetical protein
MGGKDQGRGGSGSEDGLPQLFNKVDHAVLLQVGTNCL